MTLAEIVPFGDRVLVKPDPKVEQFGLIIAPQVALADNPNYFGLTGIVVKLGDGYREDIYECLNQQCRYQTRRTVGEYCPICKATQALVAVDSDVKPFDVAIGDRVVYGKYAGKQIHLGASRLERETVIMMRESEIWGIVDGAAQVLPGYQEKYHGKATKGLTPEVVSVPR